VAYETPRTPDGTLGPLADAETFTVAGLIEALQEHVAIDPERADYPVVIWPVGRRAGNPNYLPAVAVTSGHSDPAIGGNLRVALFSLRAPEGW